MSTDQDHVADHQATPAPTAYAFAFYEVRKPDHMTVVFDLIEMAEVDVARRGWDSLKDALRPWALNILASGPYELGLYFAEFSALDEDGNPGKYVSQSYIVWNGRTELALAAR